MYYSDLYTPFSVKQKYLEVSILPVAIQMFWKDQRLFYYYNLTAIKIKSRKTKAYKSPFTPTQLNLFRRLANQPT